MEPVTINFLAVLVAAVAYMILGALWYAPSLFGNSWLRGIGKTKDQVNADFSPINYLWALIVSFLSAYGVARIMIWSDFTTIPEGIMTGLVVGICFAVTTVAMHDTFESRPRALTMINSLYHVVGLILVGIIIGAWH